MILNAPIWLNELIVTGTKILVLISIILGILSSIFLLKILYYSFIPKINHNKNYKKKSIIVALVGMILSLVVIFTFFDPKDITK